MDIYDQLRTGIADRVRHRVWIISDLQQSDLSIARDCLTTATDDFHSLDMKCEQIWYLGDAIQGKNRDVLRQMTEMQIELLQALEIPLFFACGNHEFDPYWDQLESLPLPKGENIEVISHELFSQVPTWRSSKNISDFYFKEKLGDYTLFFFPDHADENGLWFTTGGEVVGHPEAYPYTAEVYQAVAEDIRNTDGPVITAGHNSFAGGLRSSPILSQMLPLPSNVHAHFYGHCHIGDIHWGGPSCYRKLSTVDSQNIPQVDVAALENHRGDAVRSTILEIYDDGTFGVLLREHCRARWSDAYFLAPPEA